MVRRSRLEIYFDILETIYRGTHKPTRIMYKTNLSWGVLHNIFDTLIDGDFIKEVQEGSSKRYYITHKGRNSLSYHLKSLEGIVQVKQRFGR